MKVLLLNDYGVLAGGAERVTVELRDALRTRGHDVRLFASTASPIPLPNEADDCCYGTNAWGQRLLQVANPFAVRALGRVLREFRPDVIHVRMFLTQLSPAILPLLAEVPALLHVGNHQTICPLNTKVLPDGSACGVRAGLACRRSGCVSLAGLARTLVQLGAWRRRGSVFRTIVANSHALAAALLADGVPVDRVIANGTREVPARPPLADPPTVAFAGRLTPVKGVDHLLAAMVLVRQRVPSARLIIAGDGPDRRRVERLIEETGSWDGVTLTGHVVRPRLDELLGAAWVHAVPSRYPEPSANTIAEAMMRGTAVVATDTGGSPELVRDGITGHLVPVGDPEPLAERLASLLSDRDVTERMGAAAREHALAGLTVERMAERFESVYREMVAVATAVTA